MKRLILMRHAAAESAHLQSDISRTLSRKGIKEAELAGQFIANLKIDKILVSPSARTIQTAQVMLNATQDIEYAVIEDLYLASAETIINIISSLDDNINCVMALGHNPAIYQAALLKANKDSKNYEILIDTTMPTARIVVIDFKQAARWSDITYEVGSIAEIFTPE